MIHWCGAGIPAPLRFLSLVGSRASVGGAFADASRPLLLLGGLVRVASRGFFWAGEKLFTGKPRSKFARRRLGATASHGGSEIPLRAGRARGNPSRRAAASVALGEALDGECGGNLVRGLVEARL